MQFHSKVIGEILKSRQPLEQLNGCYVASAIICNNNLLVYHCNDNPWFQEFMQHWPHDSIVSTTPPVSDKFRVYEWQFNLTLEEHIQYCKHRYNITGASHGFTAARSYISSRHGLISEFYAIAATDKNSFSSQLLSDAFFVKKALQLIHNSFSKNVLDE